MTSTDRVLLPDVSPEVPDDGLSIGDTSTITGVPIETLRYYEREGLMLDPTPRDGGGRRRYHRNDIAWIAGLVMLRETGMPIVDIRILADLSRRDGTESERLAHLEAHRERVVEELARTQRHLTAIEHKIDAYRVFLHRTES